MDPALRVAISGAAQGSQYSASSTDEAHASAKKVPCTGNADLPSEIGELAGVSKTIAETDIDATAGVHIAAIGAPEISTDHAASGTGICNSAVRDTGASS